MSTVQYSPSIFDHTTVQYNHSIFKCKLYNAIKVFLTTQLYDKILVFVNVSCTKQSYSLRSKMIVGLLMRGKI